MTDRILLLLHAFPVGCGMWRPQLRAFPGWRVLAPSFPGFDGTQPPADASVEAYAAAMVEELDRHRVQEAVVAGLSMGGYVALALMRHAADRVSGLILADTRSGADSHEARDKREKMIADVREAGVSSVAAQMVPKLLGRSTQYVAPELVQDVTALILRQSEDGVTAAIRAMATRPDSTDLLAAIRVPTLVVVGEEDEVTPPTEVAGLTAIPGSRLVQIPRAGHLANLEQPEAFNGEVAAFLGRYQ